MSDPEYSVTIRDEFGNEKKEATATMNAVIDQAVKTQLEEQRRLDEAANELHRRNTGGGVISLDEPKGKFVYNNYAEGITDLAHKAEKGDPESKRLYKELWEKAIQKIKDDPPIFSIYACPSCGKGVTSKQVADNSGSCLYCSFDIHDQKRRGLDV